MWSGRRGGAQEGGRCGGDRRPGQGRGSRLGGCPRGRVKGRARPAQVRRVKGATGQPAPTCPPSEGPEPALWLSGRQGGGAPAEQAEVFVAKSRAGSRGSTDGPEDELLNSDCTRTRLRRRETSVRQPPDPQPEHAETRGRAVGRTQIATAPTSPLGFPL